jgi:hypothetical protein
LTLFHELSHKIIKTVDELCGLYDCLRIKDTPHAVTCGDSWGYFIIEYAAQTNRLPGGTPGQIRAPKAKFGG